MNLGVGALIVNARSECLLLRRLLAPEKGTWGLPGGKVESEEMPDVALQRELLEELGVRSSVGRYLGAFVYRSKGDCFVGMSFCYEACLEDEPSNCEPLIHAEIGWFSLDNLPAEIATPVSFAVTNYKTLRRHNRSTCSPCQVALIQPFFPFADKESLSIPLGLATLHACLKQGAITTKTYDCSLPSDYDGLRAELPVLKPRVIGIQFHSEMSFGWATRAARYVRDVCPESVIVAGGETATFKWHELLDRGVVDYVVFDEGDTTFVELVKSLLFGQRPRGVLGTAFWNRETGECVANPRREYVPDLDMLPMHVIDDLSWRDYGQWTLFTSRGCPFRCTFCSSAAFWRHSLRCQSPKRVYEEIVRLQRDFGARDIYIADDTFTLDRGRTEQICKLLIDHDIKVRWSCLTRADCLTPQLVQLMANAGCVLISFGMETSADGTLVLLRKQMKSVKLADALTWCKSARVRTRVSCIFGLPRETQADVRVTIEFLLKNQPDEVQLYGLTPHDGTMLFGDLGNLGIRVLESDPTLWSRNVLSPVCETEDLPRQTIVDLAQECIQRLQRHGYTYLSDGLQRRKIGAPKTVATSFSPVQSIGGVELP